MIVRRKKIEIVIVSAHDHVHVRKKENEIEKNLGVETGKLLKNSLPPPLFNQFFLRNRSRSPRRDRKDAILIRSRSPTPDVKIEVAQTDQNQTSQNGSNQKRFESVSAVSKAPSDVVLVDEIASSAYAKTFYKSKVSSNPTKDHVLELRFRNSK